MNPKPLARDEATVADAVARLAARSDRPIDFLRLVFQHCCGFEGVVVAACWVKDARQRIVLLDDYGIDPNPHHPLVSPTGDLRDGLEERFRSATLADISADYLTATKGLALHWLSVGVSGESRAAISLWHDAPLSPAETDRRHAFSRAIQAGFTRVATKAKQSRKPNTWTHIGASEREVPQEPEVRSAANAAVVALDQLSDSFDRIHSVGTSADVGGTLTSDRLLRMATIVGRSLDKRAVAYDIVNEVRSYLGRGRIGLSYVQGDQAKLASLSGVETFDHRSDVVLAIGRLCNQVAKSKHAIWHPEQAEQQPQQIAKHIEAYYEVTDAQSIALVPIHAHAAISADPNDLAAVLRHPDQNKGQLIAVLTIEGLRETIGQQDVKHLWSDAEPIVANAVKNAIQHSSVFLYPVWKTVGDGLQLFRGHHRNKAIAVTLAIAIIIAVMTFVPRDHRVKADGVLQPVQRARLYAEVAGTIDQIKVTNGQVVSAGEALLTLVNPEMEVEFERVHSEQRHTREMMIAIRNQINRGGNRDESSDRGLRKERASLEQKLISLERQLQILSLKRDKLAIVSPIAGKVMTWDLIQRLGNRPVEPGMHLLTVADETGPWELELLVPDRLTGHLHQALNAGEPNEPLLVDFVLTSDPRRVLQGKVRTVADAQTFDEGKGSVLRVYVDIPSTDSQWRKQIRSGTETIAHIHVGRRSMGYTVLYEFFDWFEQLWFRYT